MGNPLYVAFNEDGNQVAFDANEVIVIEPGVVFPVGQGRTQPIWILYFRSGSCLSVERCKTDGIISDFIRRIGRCV